MSLQLLKQTGFGQAEAATPAEVAAEALAGGRPIFIKAADYQLQAADSGKQFTGAFNFTLPVGVALVDGVAPMRFGLILTGAGSQRFTAPANNVIFYGQQSSNAGGFVSNSHIGGAGWLVNIGVNQWAFEYAPNVAWGIDQ